MPNSIDNLATSPSEVTVATYETLTIGVDTLSRLATGTTSPISPVVTLIVNDGAEPSTEITLTDSPTVSGSKIFQTIHGSTLDAGSEYLLIAVFGDGQGNTQMSITTVDCPL